MHGLQTIVKRNNAIQEEYDHKEVTRRANGNLSDEEWAKVLNVPTKEVHRILGY